jgi:hypothetical protein
MTRKYILKEKFMLAWVTDISILTKPKLFQYNFSEEMKKPGIWKLIFVLSSKHYISTKRVAIETSVADIILVDSQQPITVERRVNCNVDFSGIIFHFNKKPTEEEAEKVIQEYLDNQ